VLLLLLELSIIIQFYEQFLGDIETTGLSPSPKESTHMEHDEVQSFHILKSLIMLRKVLFFRLPY
jgi:hypothetical protein